MFSFLNVGLFMCPFHTQKEVLSDVLMDFLLDWNIDRKVSTIMVDNCSSNDEMINILVEKLSLSDSLLLNGKNVHMRCAARVKLNCQGRFGCH